MQKFKLALLFLTLLSSLKLMSQPLQVGTTAPSFERQAVMGQNINLTDYQEQKVLLAFFRYAGCPVCNFRMHELMNEYEQLQERGIAVIAVFESSEEMLQSYLKDTPVPFPVIADPELELYDAYQVNKSLGKMMNTLFKKQPKKDMKAGKALFNGKSYKRDGAQTRIPADFLIEKGVILEAHYGKYVGDHLPMHRLHQY